MSTETNTTIPNYQDAYDKAHQYIKLAMAIVKGLNGTDNKFVNGSYHGGAVHLRNEDNEREFIIPKRTTKMSIPEIKTTGIAESIQNLKEIEEFSRKEMMNATFDKLNDALKKHNQDAVNLEKLTSELQEPE